MESRTDLVRLLEEMDKVLESKKKELAELDERLDVARDKVGKREASELLDGEDKRTESGVSERKDPVRDENIRSYIAEQKRIYEQQLADFAEQLSELDAMNQKLMEENHRLTLRDQHKLDTEQQIESAYYVLSEQYQKLISENSKLRVELDQAEAKAIERQNQLDQSNQLDKVLEDVYNNKIESLNRIIELKDEEIEQLKADTQFTLESLGITSTYQSVYSDRDKMSESEPTDRRQRVIQIAATIREKDSQIESLKIQLLEATKELERSASLLESITNQQRRTRTVDTENQLSLTEQLNEVNSRCESLERELIYKDTQLTELERRNHDLEFLMPEVVSETLRALSLKLNSTTRDHDGLTDILCHQLSNLLNEMNTGHELIRKNDDLKELVKSKDRQIIQLVEDLNKLHTQFNLAIHGMKVISEDRDVVSQKTSTNDDDYKPLDSEDKFSDHDGQIVAAIPDFTSVDKLKQSDQPIATSETESLFKDGKKSSLDDHTLRESNNLDERANLETFMNLQRRLRHLEDENELLELAMKEILLCIKWSDSQCSTLLIDCPSLERLCQIIEARFVSGSWRSYSFGVRSEGANEELADPTAPRSQVDSANPDLFQFVLLKSELDILRGHNEQLRADIKAQRREYQVMYSKNTDAESQQTTKSGSTSESMPINEGVEKAKIFNQEIDQSSLDLSEPKALTTAKSCEAESQTELNLDSMNALVERAQSPVKSSVVKDCEGCERASETIHYLVQSIVRLETRVTISNDNYMLRFKHWHRLVSMLSRDLSESTKSLKEVRDECHLLRQQKYKVESKLEIMEHQVVDHLKVCPRPDSFISGTSQDIEFSTTLSDGYEESRAKIALQSGRKSFIELPTTSTRIIITLLKSIIGCLQARLVFKDERIRELETAILQMKFCASPA